MNILFFDIDGTLISTGGAGKDAMIDAVLKMAGRDKCLSDVEVSGRSDRGIAQELFELNGLTESAANWQQFVSLYLERLATNLPLRPGRILPGVKNLLEQLSRRDDIALGLITGNVQQAALLKLQHFGLWDYFSFGGFGDRHPVRDDIARDGAFAARQKLNSRYDPAHTWVIGDTPSDVSCGRAIGARTIAVATGVFSVGDLRSTEPDILWQDLGDVDAFLALL